MGPVGYVHMSARHVFEDRASEHRTSTVRSTFVACTNMSSCQTLRG